MMEAVTAQRRFLEVRAGATVWRVDAGFLTSNWQCIWGRGCQGIGDEPAEHLALGCCSEGAVFDDDDDAATVAAFAACLAEERFQYAAEARVHGVFADGRRFATRVVDGACIFLNRPGFPGGAGCALHLAALADGIDPVDVKPGVCGRIPVRADDTGPGTVTVRPWRRDDWGPGGATMAWWCTEAPEAFVGDRPVVASLEPELRRLVGDEAYEAIAAALAHEGRASGHE